VVPGTIEGLDGPSFSAPLVEEMQIANPQVANAKQIDPRPDVMTFIQLRIGR
jgi:hypothetical protein